MASGLFMSNDFIDIDNYFQGNLSNNEKEIFEKKLASDPTFAEEVAFYAHAKATLRTHILNERHADWTSRPQKKGLGIGFNKIAVGIAAMLLMVGGLWFFIRNDVTKQANTYIDQSLATLPVKMDATEDSLELGKRFYNEKNYQKANDIFERLLSTNPKALEYAGLAALQQKQYDVAMIYFEKLDQNTELLENKGKFYQALTYLKQGDERRGTAILQEIIDNNLYGKIEAEKILD